MNLLERKKTRNDEGLSLVEMVVAIVVFAIVALSAYPIFIKSVEMVSVNNLATAASVTVNGIIEDIRENPNCATINKYKGSNDYKDERGIGYDISLSVLSNAEQKCTVGEVLLFEIKAIKSSNSDSLLEQKVQVLIPPRNGVIELSE